MGIFEALQQRRGSPPPKERGWLPPCPPSGVAGVVGWGGSPLNTLGGGGPFNIWHPLRAEQKSKPCLFTNRVAEAVGEEQCESNPSVSSHRGIPHVCGGFHVRLKSPLTILSAPCGSGILPVCSPFSSRNSSVECVVTPRCFCIWGYLPAQSECLHLAVFAKNQTIGRGSVILGTDPLHLPSLPISSQPNKRTQDH